MRYAILADIHSNLTALEAVLADIEKHGRADETWCLGDIVGYGPDPHESIELLRKVSSTFVAGNHDWAAIGKIDTSLFNPEATEAAHWTAGQLESEDIRFLERLPLVIEKGNFTLAHGSPGDPIWEYVLSAETAEENLGHFKTKYCLIGHSHVPLIFECNEFNSCSLIRPAVDRHIKLGDKRMIINPGGVGQPRDNDPRTSYAIYDNESGFLTFHRIEYDIKSVQRKMEQMGLPNRLISRLAYGR